MEEIKRQKLAKPRNMKGRLNEQICEDWYELTASSEGEYNRKQAFLLFLKQN